MAKLAGAPLLKPCKPIPYNLWTKANTAVVEKEYKRRCKLTPPTKKDHLTFLGRVTCELFVKLSSQEKAV
jgi:hypothetical protein